VAVVPADALIANAQGTRVAVVDGANKVHFRDVQVGRDFGAQVEILSGIGKEDAVVSNAPDTLVEGQQVSVQRAAGESKQ
jgi:hypothetical protein